MRTLLTLSKFSVIFSYSIDLQNELTKDDCDWWDGDYGVPIQCPPGTVARGACGSGRRDDCSSTMRPGDKTTTQLYCCKTQYQNDPISKIDGSHDCSQKHGNAGSPKQCGEHHNQMKPIFRLCGSGMNSDCKADDNHHYSHVLDCCYSSDLEVSGENMCVWSYKGV